MRRYKLSGIPFTPCGSRGPNPGSPPPFGSVAPLPITFKVHSGARSRASRFADAYCGRTLFQSHCNSSATIMALEVQTPWPSSVWPMRIVTVSSGDMTTQALTSGVAESSYQTGRGPVCSFACAFACGGTQKPRMKAPCAAAAIARNSRRLTSDTVFSLIIASPPSSGLRPGGWPAGYDGKCRSGKCSSPRR